MNLAIVTLFTACFTFQLDQTSTFNRQEFTSEEIRLIEEKSRELLHATGYHFIIQSADTLIDSRATTYLDKVVEVTIDYEGQRTVLLVFKKDEFLSEEYFQNLDDLFIEPGISGNNLAESILWMLDDIIRSYSLEKQKLEEYVVREQEEPEQSPHFYTVIKWFVWITILYVLKTLHSIFFAGLNKAEYWEYYGYTRLAQKRKLFVGIAIISASAIFLWQYVYYYSEIIVVYLLFIIVGRPIVLLSSFLVKLIEDWILISKIKTVKSENLSAGQKKYLLNPKLKTEEYIFLDLYELFFFGHLRIISEAKDARRPNKYYHYVYRNFEEQREGLSAFQQYILSLFPQGKEQFYILYHLFGKILSDVHGFKGYKKDYLLLDMVRQGLYKRQPWVFNYFFPSHEGIETKSRLARKEGEIKKLINSFRSDSRSVKIDQINEDIFLLQYPEKVIDDIYDLLFKNGELNSASETNLAVLLMPTFSFADFRSAMRKQISVRYRKHLGNPEDYTDN